MTSFIIALLQFFGLLACVLVVVLLICFSIAYSLGEINRGLKWEKGSNGWTSKNKEI